MRNHHFRFDVYYMHSNLRWRFRNILRPSQFSEYLNFNIWIYSAFLVALSSHIFYCTSLVLDCALIGLFLQKNPLRFSDIWIMILVIKNLENRHDVMRPLSMLWYITFFLHLPIKVSLKPADSELVTLTKERQLSK